MKAQTFNAKSTEFPIGQMVTGKDKDGNQVTGILERVNRPGVDGFPKGGFLKNTEIIFCIRVENVEKETYDPSSWDTKTKKYGTTTVRQVCKHGNAINEITLAERSGQ